MVQKVAKTNAGVLYRPTQYSRLVWAGILRVRSTRRGSEVRLFQGLRPDTYSMYMGNPDTNTLNMEILILN